MESSFERMLQLWQHDQSCCSLLPLQLFQRQVLGGAIVATGGTEQRGGTGGIGSSLTGKRPPRLSCGQLAIN